MSREMTATSQPLGKPPTKRRTGPSILFAVLTAVVAIVEVCGLTAGAANANGDLPKVTYQLSGSSAVAEYVSYQTDTGQQHQAHVPLPWTTQFTAFGGQVFVVSAEAPGSITCTILVDGNVVSNATANGRPARTVCSH
jgi:MmpS family membrane protein